MVSQLHLVIYEPQQTDALTSSWAAYNLLGACTACQGFDSSIQKFVSVHKICCSFSLKAANSWPPYKAGCGADFLSTTYVSTRELTPASH